MAEPLVSVIIPCYNVSAYVEEAVTSILEQTYKNLEIWLVDDASTDDTLIKLKSFTDERIRLLIFEKNTRKVGAVNEVLKQVQGDFICFQDADDWSSLEKIQLQLDVFKASPGLGICFTNSLVIGGEKKQPGTIALSNEELRKEFLEFGKHKFENPTVCGTMMITRKALLNTNGYDTYFAGRVAEDIQWIYRILKEFEGATLTQALYHYRRRQGSFTDSTATGKNAKYAYSCHLLSMLIENDIKHNIDLLLPENKEALHATELAACEMALKEAIELLSQTKETYEQSTSFKLGRLLLRPWHLLQSK
jgi:glycosyltransferase involved in cell wall biosynthesis